MCCARHQMAFILKSLTDSPVRPTVTFMRFKVSAVARELFDVRDVTDTALKDAPPTIHGLHRAVIVLSQLCVYDTSRTAGEVPRY